VRSLSTGRGRHVEVESVKIKGNLATNDGEIAVNWALDGHGIFTLAARAELVDAMTARMLNKPATLDTIVATNLHADILSDLAAALAGSLGIAPTGNIDPEHRYPSMFEPIHGSAFDIMRGSGPSPSQDT
jgi:isocitrate dehydrogenase